MLLRFYYIINRLSERASKLTNNQKKGENNVKSNNYKSRIKKRGLGV